MSPVSLKVAPIQISKRHPRNSSIEKVEKLTESKTVKPLPYYVTLKKQDSPSWQSDNPWIISGYRQITHSYYYCYLSLFYMHNESGNVYTHGIAFAFCIVFWIWNEFGEIKTTTFLDYASLACLLPFRLRYLFGLLDHVPLILLP